MILVGDTGFLLKICWMQQDKTKAGVVSLGFFGVL
jgi:hypothetical protein